MIHVIASIEVEPGTRAEFIAHFNDNVPNVLAEDGCLGYGPTVDLDTGIAVQVPLRENVVTIVEQWESLDHLRAHISAPHMASYREKVKHIVKGASLQVLAPA
jgi:quinol monooxygenase YgiN